MEQVRPYMDQTAEIGKLKARSDAVNVSFHRLCQQADVPKNTLSRWERNATDARRGQYNDYMGRLHRELTKIETEIFLTLAARFLTESDVLHLKSLIESAAANGVSVAAADDRPAA